MHGSAQSSPALCIKLESEYQICFQARWSSYEKAWATILRLVKSKIFKKMYKKKTKFPNNNYKNFFQSGLENQALLKLLKLIWILIVRSH